MSLSFSATLQHIIATGFQNVGDISTATDNLGISDSVVFTDGTGDNQAQAHWAKNITLAASADTTLDLSALVGGLFGDIGFSAIKAVYIRVNSVDAALEIKDGASNGNLLWHKAAGDITVIPQAGFLQVEHPTDGWTVDATHKTILLTNASGANGIDFDIVVIGLGALV